MIILSVDYGDARTGIAVCDKSEFLASPVCVIKDGYEKRVISRVLEIAAEKKAELIVVGNPKNMDGTSGERSLKCSAFAEKLRQAGAVPVEMWDERLTTVSAHRALDMTNTWGKARKNIIDAVSAVMILEDFMAYRKNMGAGYK